MSQPRETDSAVEPAAPAPQPEKTGAEVPPKEIGGPQGPDPTRFGDWERKGRCIDF